MCVCGGGERSPIVQLLEHCAANLHIGIRIELPVFKPVVRGLNPSEGWEASVIPEDQSDTVAGLDIGENPVDFSSKHRPVKHRLIPICALLEETSMI